MNAENAARPVHACEVLREEFDAARLTPTAFLGEMHSLGYRLLIVSIGSMARVICARGIFATCLR